MEKIKSVIINSFESEKGKDIFTVFIIILVGLGSFELGRLSKNSQNSGIKIEYPNQVTTQSANVVSALGSIQEPINTTKSAQKGFFGSNRGSKYYSLGCSAGKTIKQENRIYFTTEAEAIKAGYTKSTSC